MSDSTPDPTQGPAAALTGWADPGSSPDWDDSILPFQLDRSGLRGRVVRLDTTLERILTQHDYPGPVAGLVAEAVLLVAAIGQAIKLRGKLSIQIRGQGAIRLIATDIVAATEGQPARLRGYAAYDAEALAAAPAATPAFAHLGSGIFALMVDEGGHTRPYQGITPLAGGSVAACAETYFAQSEQLPTRFAVAMAQDYDSGAPRWRGGAVMLQHLAAPGEHVREADDADNTGHGGHGKAGSGEGGSGEAGLLMAEDVLPGNMAEPWARATSHLATVELSELIGPQVGTRTLLRRLFHEEEPRIFEPVPLGFGCTCSAGKVAEVLASANPQDRAAMTNPEGKVEADCQFCGAHYELDPHTL